MADPEASDYSLKEIDEMRIAVWKRLAAEEKHELDEVSMTDVENRLKTYILAGVRLHEFEGGQADG